MSKQTEERRKRRQKRVENGKRKRGPFAGMAGYTGCRPRRLVVDVKKDPRFFDALAALMRGA